MDVFFTVLYVFLWYMQAARNQILAFRPILAVIMLLK